MSYIVYICIQCKRPMPSTVVSLRVSEQQAERLQRKARQIGRTPSETGAILLDESLRRDELAFIDFRESPVGRQAYIQGSRLAVWQVVSLIRSYKGGLKQAAAHLQWPVAKIQAALNYSRAFPEEVENAIHDNQSFNFDQISRLLPDAKTFVPRACSRKKR